LNETVGIRFTERSGQLKTIAAAKLIREHSGIDLAKAKDLVEEVMQGKVGRIQIHGQDHAKQFIADAAVCGLVAEIE
jgi:ribosomal protein L7/L12